MGMVDFWDVLHDGIYLGMVQKAEISFESVQTEYWFNKRRHQINV